MIEFKNPNDINGVIHQMVYKVDWVISDKENSSPGCK